MSTLRKELGTRLKKRSTDVFAYMLRTAWAMVFREIFNMLIGKDPPFHIRLLTAICFTLIAVVVTVYTTSDEEETDDLLEAEA